MFESLQPAAYAVSFIFYVLSTTATVLRIYSRKSIIRSFGKDDWWMTSVFVYNSFQQGLFCAFLYYGGGLHADKANPEYFPILLKLLFAEEIVYIWMQFVIKMGFLLFYLRLANKTTFLRSVYVTMVLNFLIAVTLWLLYCLQCRPLPAFWNPKAYPDAKCLKTSVTYYVPVSFNIFTDFVILILPIPPVWKMQASLSRRLGVIAVVTVGGVAVLVSCLRIIVLHEFAVNPDFTYILGKMVIISAVELNVAITAANAPALKAVWLKHVTGSIRDYMSSIHLSSLAKKQRSAGQEPSVVYQRSHPKPDDLPDSSSTNNLVEPMASNDPAAASVDSRD